MKKQTKREFLKASGATFLTLTAASCSSGVSASDVSRSDGGLLDVMQNEDALKADVFASDVLTPDVLESCRIFPAFDEGPFYVNTGLVRRDLTEGFVGTPLEVRLTLLNAATCAPISGLLVDLWATSPSGDYSGVDNGLLVEGAPNLEGQTFMRGQQVSDDVGMVTFQTLYPGWYPITPPHLHFTAPFDDQRSFTWQFYLDDSFSDVLYQEAEAYRDRGVHPVRSADRNAPDAMVIIPSGTSTSVLIDQIVAIDTSRLGSPAREY